MRAWVYLLRCADGSLYCGWTTDVDRRLREHNAGTASRYTRPRTPVALAAAWEVQGGRSAALMLCTALALLMLPEVRAPA